MTELINQNVVKCVRPWIVWSDRRIKVNPGPQPRRQQGWMPMPATWECLCIGNTLDRRNIFCYCLSETLLTRIIPVPFQESSEFFLSSVYKSSWLKASISFPANFFENCGSFLRSANTAFFDGVSINPVQSE